MKTVLIVDDELDIQSSLSFALKDEGYEVLTASSPAEAEKILELQHIDLGLYDVWFPEGDGMDLLQLTHGRFPTVSVVMMSGHGNIELALKSVRLGAYDFIEKPLELEKVLVVLRNAAAALELKKENERLVQKIFQKNPLIGESLAMKNLKAQIQKASSANSPVMILGENGTGKELVARLLHDLSTRKDKPFVGINCAAIPEGLIESELFGHEKGSFTGASARHVGRFEQADAGTLFLDEISELTPGAQSKLLRVLQEKSFERVGGRAVLKCDARIVVASNKDLQAEVKSGKFREDLFFRLNVLLLTVPPLKQRSEDIPLLAEHFVKVSAAENGKHAPQLKPELVQWMKNYDFPGNVRELRNLIERMLIMGADQNFLGLSDLPEELQALTGADAASALAHVPDPSGTLRDLRSQFEKMILEQRLEKHAFNVTKTADSLGIERAHLHRKMKQYGIVVNRGEMA